ncbi:E3 ubiquitin-protein ligase TRIM33-like [Mercenaria mercenaria]|uniref:E3 ubiquitin-protein ligase TRIM33-like n=1 Tax=Mercenaria mercenaria TaxID=6596 RepID=UPI001E1DA2E8|nr:E3 ubiquitin-protein ligase TRIM33-like [Mercenaria mercenaria]
MAVSGRKAQQEFSSSLSKGSGEDYEIFCQPCDRDNLILPAYGFCTDCEEHLCESCFNHHRRAKPSRHHTLLDAHNMPQTLQVPSKSAQMVQSSDLTTPCPEHKKEIIKFYCKDHEALLCSVCVTLDHTKTFCQVSYIPDISKQSLSSKEYTDTLKGLGNLTDTIKKTQTDLREKTLSSNKSLTDVLADIKKFRQEMIKRLYELEKEAEDMTKSLQQENDTKLKTAETICNDVTKSLKTSFESIQQFNASKQADRLFMQLKFAEQLIKDSKKRLSLLVSPEAYHFQPNSAIVSSLQEGKSLGTITHEILGEKQGYIQRFSEHGIDWGYRINKKDAIVVEASQDVRIDFIYVYGNCKVDGNMEVLLEIQDERNNIISSTEANVGCRVTKPTYEIGVENENGSYGVRLNAGEEYHIILTIKADNSYYGKGGKSKCSAEGVDFVFKNSRFSSNNTSVSTGQLAGFKFAIC